MAHPQGTNRGYIAKQRIDVGKAQSTYDSTGNVKFNAGLALSGGSDVITQDSTGNVAITDGIKISGQTSAVTQSANGLIIPVVTSAPTGRVHNGTIAVLQNSTGQAVMLNTTGTTWKYLNVTDAQPS
jgi:hypothetical protein